MEENLNNEEVMTEDFDRTLVVTDENNNQVEIEVLDIFTVDSYPDKEYILYTKNEIEGEYVKTYVSILQETETSVTLLGIEDETEFAAVQEKINSNFEETGE